jgi:hypothetical protein
MEFVVLILDMYLSSSRGYLNRGDDFNSSMMKISNGYAFEMCFQTFNFV